MTSTEANTEANSVAVNGFAIHHRPDAVSLDYAGEILYETGEHYVLLMADTLLILVGFWKITEGARTTMAPKNECLVFATKEECLSKLFDINMTKLDACNEDTPEAPEYTEEVPL